jgi:Flp pilus assembly protein TadG
MLPALPALARRFADDTRGVIAMTFSIALFVVIMFVGCAVDIARLNHARTKVISAVDAATIFAAKRLKDTGMTQATLQSLAQTFFNENMKSGANLATITGFQLVVAGDNEGVTINVKSEVPTTFARVAGINKMDVPATATAIFNSQDIEVGLQLDVTGSMGSTIAGQRKIDSLKVASKNLLDILMPSSGSGTTKVRVGIAPFAAGVNAGSYASAVATGSAPGNCVYERISSFADTTDLPPGGSDNFKTLNDLPKGAQSCPGGAKIAALSDNKAQLIGAINSLSPGGSTAGHLGTSWAWYLLSPNWSGVWPSASKPAAYNDPKVLKFAILMTDGIYNTVGGASTGDFGTTAAQSQQRAKDLCDAMKAKGIVIYSVGFIAAGDPPAAADTLKYCASTAGTFYQAQDGTQLDAAFQNIAKDISRLRISK